MFVYKNHKRIHYSERGKNLELHNLSNLLPPIQETECNIFLESSACMQGLQMVFLSKENRDT